MNFTSRRNKTGSITLTPVIRVRADGKKVTDVPLSEVYGTSSSSTATGNLNGDDHARAPCHSPGITVSAFIAPETDDMEDMTPMSSHLEAKLATVNAWQSLRNDLAVCAHELASPAVRECVVCATATSEIVKCDDCGPAYFVCGSCAISDHRHRPLHTMFMWKVRIFALLYT